MWNLVNTLQIIVYFNKVDVNLSVEAQVFLEKLRIIALGEFIPYDWLKNYIRKQWNINFESLDRMGSIAIVILSLAVFSILLILIGKLVDKLGYSKRIIDIAKKKLFWNTFLRTSL